MKARSASVITVLRGSRWGRAPDDPTAMPEEIIKWMEDHGWGDHHTKWHTERNWDLLAPEELATAVQIGRSRYAIQEAEEGNGMEFLAMHRVMVRMLRTAFPPHKALFDGWTTPRTDPFQAGDELPGKSRAPFRPLLATAISRLSRDQELVNFVGDDELGRYLEPSLNPIPREPKRRSSDVTAGIHNYLHNRWTLESSPIDLGKRRVNTNNERFWRLHGWIDKRWDQYRTLSGRTEAEVIYAAALKKGEEHLNPAHDHMHHGQAIVESLLKAARRLLLQSL